MIAAAAEACSTASDWPEAAVLIAVVAMIGFVIWVMTK